MRRFAVVKSWSLGGRGVDQALGINDSFQKAEHEERGLRPAADLDKNVGTNLIRRAEETSAFFTIVAYVGISFAQRYLFNQ